MDYESNIGKAVGIVSKRIGDGHARVKVLAIKENEVEIPSDEEVSRKFPPFGFVFGASFFKEYSDLSENDLIIFKYERSESFFEEDDKDKYIISRGSAEKYYLRTFELRGFSKSKYAVNLEEIEVNTDGYTGKFYGYTNKYIVGEFCISDNVITPAFRKRIRVWDLDECPTINYHGKIYLLKEPNGESLLLDCMNEKQLFEWFRAKLRIIDSEWVQRLDIGTNWRKELPDILDNSDNDSYELDKIRLDRIKDKLDYLKLSTEEIRIFINTSEILHDVFKSVIDQHKNEYIANYQEELNIIKQKIERETGKLKQINEKCSTTEKELEHITKNKQRILSDFSVIKDVLVNQQPSIISPNTEAPYIIEEIVRNYDDALIHEREKFLEKFQYYLNNYKLNVKLASRLLDVISIYSCILIPDISIGLAFIESTGDAKYVVQQVEVDWIRFKNFWENGLGELWKSAHESSDRIHCLLLEDLNMAAPECYGRPLLDILSGIRKRIPYGKTEMPDNLKIFATKAPTDMPKIGLPLYSQTLKDCGAIGFSGRYNFKTDEKSELPQVEGYLDANSLKQFKPGDFETENIINDIKSEFDDVIDD